MSQLRRVEPKPGSAGTYVKPWEVRYSVYRNGARHTKRRRFTRKEDAEAFKATLDFERVHGGVVDRSRRKQRFAAYAERWLAQKATRLKPRTIEDYRALLDRHALPRFGGHAIGSITVAEVNDFVRELRDTGLTPASVRHAINPLRSVLRLALREGVISINPAADIELPTNSSDGRPTFKPVVLSPDQVSSLIDAADAIAANDVDGLVNALVVQVLAFAGPRAAEVSGLRRGDFRYNASKRCDCLYIERTVRKVRGGYEVGTPKSAASTRDVELPPSIANAIRDYLDTVHPSTDPDAPLFPGRRNGGTHEPNTSMLDWSKPWDRDAFSKKVLKPALAKAGLNPRTRLHDLRHFSCSNSVESGQSVNRVALRHGHADPAFTSRRYVHPFDETAASDMAALDVIAARTARRLEKAGVVSLTEARNRRAQGAF